MQNFPCKDCKEKVLGCHSTCDMYISAVAENEARKKTIHEGKEKDRLLYAGGALSKEQMKKHYYR